jgi:tRNA(Met) cytidine acetyltransferase
MDVDPRPFRALARKHLIDPADPDCLRAREERLLVAKVLQARGWEEIAEELGYESRRQCARATGRTYQSLLECYGTEAARAERDRFSDGD